MIVSVATVTVPVRAAPVLAATVILTIPLPEPLAPEVIESHETSGVAVQAQPPAVLTDTGLAAPPAAAIDSVVGLRV